MTRLANCEFISKLRVAGLRGKLLDWLHAYLRDRCQRVTVPGATSRDLPVSSGVPQGSILGPALFLLHVNNLPEVITKSQVVMFADGTKIYKEVKSQDDDAALQQDLHSLSSFVLVKWRPYCPGRPKQLCFTTPSLAVKTVGARLGVVKQSFLGLPGQYGRRVTRANGRLPLV